MTAGRRRASTPVDVSRLDVNVTEHPQCRRVLDIVIPLEIVEAEQRAARRKLASGIRVKGFRKGRAPAHVLAEYGAELEERMLQDLVRESVAVALKEHGLQPYSKVAVENVRFSPGEPVSFRAAFDVTPKVVVKRVHGFRQEPLPSREPDEEEVDLQVERLRLERTNWRRVDDGNPKAGDSALIAISQVGDQPEGDEWRSGSKVANRKANGYGSPMDGDEPGNGADADDGMRSYRFVLGRAEALPGIEKAVESMEPGGEGVFDVPFPGSSESEPGDVRAMRIRLMERYVPELPELNDDFAASVGDFESVEALRDDVRSRLTQLYEIARKREMDAKLVRQVVEANAVEAPRSMIEALLDAKIAGLEPADEERAAQLRAELREDAEAAAKRFLIFGAIVEQFELAPTEEEVDEEIEELAKHAGETPSRVYAALQKSGEIRDLVSTLEERKVIEFLRSRSPLPEE